MPGWIELGGGVRELLVGLALVWLGFGLQRRIWAASHEQAAKVPPPDPDPEPDEEALGVEVHWEVLAPDLEPTPRDACLFHGPGLRFNAEHPRLGGPFVLDLAWVADPGARARVGLEANDPAQVLACLTQASRSGAGACASPAAPLSRSEGPASSPDPPRWPRADRFGRGGRSCAPGGGRWAVVAD